MATYPINEGGKGAAVIVTPDAGIQFTRMSDGTIRGFKDYPEPVFRLTITHFWMIEADVESVKGFYEANATVLNTVLTEMEGAYSVIFVNRPEVVAKQAGLMTLVSEMIGTKV